MNNVAICAATISHMGKVYKCSLPAGDWAHPQSNGVVEHVATNGMMVTAVWKNKRQEN